MSLSPVPRVSVQRELLTYCLCGLPIGYVITAIISALLAFGSPEIGPYNLLAILLAAGLAVASILVPNAWILMATLGLLPAAVSSAAAFFLAPKIPSRFGRATASACVGALASFIWAKIIGAIAGDESLLGVITLDAFAWITSVGGAVSAWCCSLIVDHAAAKSLSLAEAG